MANIATNTYLFYGDRDELAKCHAALSKLYAKHGTNECCVDLSDYSTNSEWFDYVSDFSDHAEKIEIGTNSNWYGNPVYWNNWTKKNFPKLSMAFRCEESSMGIFEQIDPDHKLDEVVYLSGDPIPDEDIAKLPAALQEIIQDNHDCKYIYETFLKSDIFSDDFKPADLPDSIGYNEFAETTYEEVDASNKAFNAVFNLKFPTA